MEDPGWLVQIYAVSDALAQATMFELLAGIGSLTVQATRSGLDSFLIVECSGDEQAWSVHRFVTSSDEGAKLLHTSQATVPVRARGSEIAWS